MDKPLNEDNTRSTGDAPQLLDADSGDRRSPPSAEERRAERVAKRKAAEADMSWDEIKASRRARAADRQERLAALPEEERAEKEAELAKAREARLAARAQS